MSDLKITPDQLPARQNPLLEAIVVIDQLDDQQRLKTYKTLLQNIQALFQTHYDTQYAAIGSEGSNSSAALDAHKVDPAAHSQYLTETEAGFLYARLDALSELIDDRVAVLLQPGANATLEYNDALGRLIISAAASEITWIETNAATALQLNHGYLLKHFANNPHTLPESAVLGKEIYVIGSDGWEISSSAPGLIYLENGSSGTNLSNTLAFPRASGVLRSLGGHNWIFVGNLNSVAVSTPDPAAA
jgi:hypothetical protein